MVDATEVVMDLSRHNKDDKSIMRPGRCGLPKPWLATTSFVVTNHLYFTRVFLLTKSWRPFFLMTERQYKNISTTYIVHTM